jgi:hypothetical protein
LWNAYFYAGKSRSADDEHEDVSVTLETVTKLLTPLKGKNNRVYMNNCYPGIPLFKEPLTFAQPHPVLYTCPASN